MTDKIIDMIAAREKTHGRFADTAESAQELKAALYNRKGWHRMNLMQREAIDMISSKLARLANGDPNHLDSWLDIAGYALLAAPLVAFDDENEGENNG